METDHQLSECDTAPNKQLSTTTIACKVVSRLDFSITFAQMSTAAALLMYSLHTRELLHKLANAAAALSCKSSMALESSELVSFLSTDVVNLRAVERADIAPASANLERSNID
jgi:hypothetical protein